jgi:HECT-domain (ubiquitin-transferase)
MFEGILLELPLAGFFLKKFRGGAWCDVNDLPTLDAELYRNLMVLRDYQGDAADLALTFTVADSTLGAHREVGANPFGVSSSHHSHGIQYGMVGASRAACFGAFEGVDYSCYW